MKQFARSINSWAFPAAWIMVICLNVPSQAALTPAAPLLYNTQKETSPLLTATQALQKIQLPAGFEASLFAGEPDVYQPIGINTDSRGRVWIAENFTYAEQAVNFATNLHDRIIILEDTDHDGQSDKRTVFWDRAQKLTSIAPGFGGVYALCPPHLLFIPDRNNDDIPDAEPTILLDGWEADAVRHNIVNGLKWGPDGWLYGRHGILATSRVGKPGTAPEARTALNCAIWRFHPVSHAFEVVAQGTTNPWGHDWDEQGQLFFINTVIGHLWHVVPGAYYKRMYGEHFNQRLYELIDQTADHVHWNTNETWDEIRQLGVTPVTSSAGGGHAHSGFMFYLGDTWPERYRNTAFTINFHGRRLNNDRVLRHGATYTARHAPDFMQSDDVWFRGIELMQGQGGTVYLCDWSDLGECHDQDGIHRTSGRVYAINYGTPKPSPIADLSRLSPDRLADLQLSSDEWLVRQARLVLHERAAQGTDLSSVHRRMRQAFATEKAVTKQLRALWCLYVTGGTSDAWLQEQLRHDQEHVRVWAVQLLVDRQPASPALLEEFVDLAKREKSGLVLTFLASVLQKATTDRWPLAAALATHGEFSNDPVFPLMLWYGVEPDLATPPAQAAKVAVETKIPTLRRLMARRWAEDPNQKNADLMLSLLVEENEPAVAEDILHGFASGLRGLRQTTPPPSWNKVVQRFRDGAPEPVRDLIRELSVMFGDMDAIDELRRIAADRSAELNTRRRALQTLAQTRVTPLIPLLTNLLSELEIAPDAIRALATTGDDSTPSILLSRYAGLRSRQAKVEVVAALASRPAYADELVSAVRQGVIPPQDVGKFHVRQMRSFKGRELARQLEALWPASRPISAEKKTQMEHYERMLAPENLSGANLGRGRQLYGQACAGCHVLFGEGSRIGPELTGSDRRNLAYLLENILDPSNVVAENYRLSVLTLKDGRIVNGVVGAKTPRTVEVQTPTEKLVIENENIESITASKLSMMPEGLLEAFTPEQARDLVSYLMAPEPSAP